MKQFSVLMSVYCNDKPDNLRIAVESVSIKQTLQPDELILVVDGPVSELIKTEIETLCAEIPYIKLLWKAQNEGLGKALRDGLSVATYDIIARMDSDDIAVPNRFEKQLAQFVADESLGLIGSCISEFIDNPSNIVSHRVVPSTDKKIRVYMKKRCPFNHVSVMYKKSEVLKAGNYKDYFWNEDYYLWIRLMISGCKFANLQDNLVNVRVGKDMYARRGGLKYFKSEEGIQRFMLKNGVIGLPLYLFNVLVRFSVQVVMPDWLRGFIFKKLFRK